MNIKLKKLLLGSTSVLGAASLLAASAGCSTTETQEKPTNPENPGTTPGTPGTTDPTPGTTEPVTPGSDLFFGTTEADRIDNASAPTTNKTILEKRYDQNASDKIVIGATFSDGSRQADGLKKLMDVYNNLIKNEAAREGETAFDINVAKPVEYKGLGSGYATGAENISKALGTSQKDDFLNATLNYTGVAAKLAANNMLVSFNSDVPSLNTDVTSMAIKFAKPNAQTEGIDKISTWVLPAFKSTVIMAINSPVLSYVLETFVSNGMTVDADFQDEYNKLKTTGQTDRTEVVKIWGEPVSGAKGIVDKFKEKYSTISKSLFESYGAIFDFAQAAQSLFVNSSSGSSDLHIFGVDDAAAVFNQALYSMLLAEYNGDEELASRNMIESVNRAEGKITISYDVIHNTSSQSNAKAREFFDALVPAIQNGGVMLNPGGVFSSTNQKNHKYAFSIGSTAGYTHNFVKGSKSQVSLSYSVNDKKYSLTSGNQAVNDNYDGVAKLGKKGDDYTIGKRDNKILAPNVNGGKYDWYFVNDESKQEFDTVVGKIPGQEITDSKTLIVTFNIKALTEEEKTALIAKAKEAGIYAGLIKKSTSDDQFMALVIQNGIANGNFDSSAIDKLKAAGIEASILGTTSTLQEDELFAWDAPGKFKPSDPKNVIYGQGPSFIGVHANDESDDALRAFIKWLMTSNKVYADLKLDDKDKADEGLTPRNYLQSQMGYILPYEGFWNDTTFLKKNAKNKYLVSAFNLFAKASNPEDKDNSKYVIFEEPGSLHADAFRNSVVSAFDKLQNSVTNKTGETTSFTDFIATIKI
ncbi:P80 family lipoprotein [Mycoplasma sp. Pen4]|uniref:P68 family surface lipoprotein n=1 Tax=Mycoplasma sp. Pen4 TaxID=640330 RepID=UPI0016541679|nr:P80 family lipoprotein [Mycoplasma sp. Pen4]QNM93581.1 P80 family lipoprotein [Mycoplasma sp. Pen4]